MFLEERVKAGNWWSQKESLLNLSDINLPPEYYQRDAWEWVQELTMYIYLEPEVWQEIYSEYIVIAKLNGNTEHVELKYYRDDEGYIRMKGEEDTYLQISVNTADIIVLKKVGDWMCANSMKFRLEYVDYCEMTSDQRIHWLKRTEMCIKEMFSKVHGVRMAHGLEEAQFDNTEVFYDFLNTVYIIL